MIGDHIAVIEQRAPFSKTHWQWVVSDSTHCEPSDKVKTNQWVYALTL